MLWEMAYGEIIVTDKLWPDFRKPDLIEAIEEFTHRERRFGKLQNKINENQSLLYLNYGINND